MTTLEFKIIEFLTNNYELPPLTYGRDTPPSDVSADICQNVTGDYSFDDVNTIYKKFVEEKYNHIGSLDIKDKLKYLKITTQDDLKKLEDMHYHPHSGGCAFYLQSDEYNKCYEPK